MDDCPFTAVEKPAEPNVPVAAKSEGQTIREYRLDGKLSLINLTRANLDVGTMVQKVSKADPANFKILAIDESSNQVSLEAKTVLSTLLLSAICSTIIKRRSGSNRFSC